MKITRRRLTTLPLAGAAAALLLAGCASEGGSGVQSEKLAMISGRGKLICGVDGKLPGFSFVGPDGTYRGLDVDVCRALAAAVLGDPAKLEFRDLNSSERFAALSSGEVDVLSRNTTTTLSRDAVQGLDHAQEAGGLSGAPVLEASNRVIAQLRQALGPAFPIIGVGGILSGADAVSKLQAGADLVQIYTGLIYRGPELVRECALALQAFGRA